MYKNYSVEFTYENRLGDRITADCEGYRNIPDLAAALEYTAKNLPTLYGLTVVEIIVKAVEEDKG